MFTSAYPIFLKFIPSLSSSLYLLLHNIKCKIVLVCWPRVIYQTNLICSTICQLLPQTLRLPKKEKETNISWVHIQEAVFKVKLDFDHETLKRSGKCEISLAMFGVIFPFYIGQKWVTNRSGQAWHIKVVIFCVHNFAIIQSLENFHIIDIFTNPFYLGKVPYLHKMGSKLGPLS